MNFDADDLYPDVRPGLAALRDLGYELIIAGNQPPQAYDALTAMDLPVDAVYTSDGWGVAKPDPAFFAEVVAVSGREPGRSSTWATVSTTTCSPPGQRACGPP
nr:hypothetical protein GCM10020093_042970 [Planobispora longispora]